MGAATACAIALVLAAIILPWPERVRDRLMGVITGLAALCFFHNELPLGTDQLLDGRELEFHFEPASTPSLPPREKVSGSVAPQR